MVQFQAPAVQIFPRKFKKLELTRRVSINLHQCQSLLKVDHIYPRIVLDAHHPTNKWASIKIVDVYESQHPWKFRYNLNLLKVLAM